MDVLATFPHRRQVFTLPISTALTDKSTPSSLTQFKNRGTLGAMCVVVVGTVHVAVEGIMGTEDLLLEGGGPRDMVVGSRR